MLGLRTKNLLGSKTLSWPGIYRDWKWVVSLAWCTYLCSNVCRRATAPLLRRSKWGHIIRHTMHVSNSQWRLDTELGSVGPLPWLNILNNWLRSNRWFSLKASSFIKMDMLHMDADFSSAPLMLLFVRIKKKKAMLYWRCSDNPFQ